MQAEACGLFLDYSKNRIKAETLSLLFELAREARLSERTTAMFEGERINTTERRAVLHTALRRPSSDVLMVDGQIVASVQPRTLDGHPWPVREDRVTDLRDVAKAVLALARAAGVSPQMLAQAMGDNGLPTTAARLKNISTMEQGRRSATSPAELVAMCYAAIAVLNDEKTS